MAVAVAVSVAVAVAVCVSVAVASSVSVAVAPAVSVAVAVAPAALEPGCAVAARRAPVFAAFCVLLVPKLAAFCALLDPKFAAFCALLAPKLAAFCALLVPKFGAFCVFLVPNSAISRSISRLFLYFSRGDAAPNPQTPTVFGRSSEWCGGETGPGEGGAADSACGSAIFGVLGGNWVGKGPKITEIGGGLYI
jgi:hypothetical protein